uniref:Ig-like domain-containing protein n=1 Tax=Plectus sambesii TaxID=2011161 RepID=A0A914WB98_9BILA
MRATVKFKQNANIIYQVVVIARNSEGEALSTGALDVFTSRDFRHVQLKPAVIKSGQEMEEREQLWQQEMLGTLGQAFQQAPKPDAQKLHRVEREKTPPEPLETEELMSKFTRKRDEDFYEKFVQAEQTKLPITNMELEPVQLKPGFIQRYEPPTEEMETVALKPAPRTDSTQGIPEGGAVIPVWTKGNTRRFAPGEQENRFKQRPPAPREQILPAKDQVQLKMAKPKPAAELPPTVHVELDTEKATLAAPKQKPAPPKEEVIPAADQVQLKRAYKPKPVGQGEAVKLEDTQLKQTPPVVKTEEEKQTISSKRMQYYEEYYLDEAGSRQYLSTENETYSETGEVKRMKYNQLSPRQREWVQGFHMIRLNDPSPTRVGQSQKTPPAISQQLKPVQAEIGKPARFQCAFDGARPLTVTWLKDGQPISSNFEFQVKTTDTGSTLEISKVKSEMTGQYTCRIENVAGRVESLANLAVTDRTDQGEAPNFARPLQDNRVTQGHPVQFDCNVTGKPKATVTWFKDGKAVAPDVRFKMLVDDGQNSLLIIEALPQDAGVYECVARNSAGEARCKAKLNVNLAKTGGPAEAGPKLEAPKFQNQIQPIIAQEGQAARFEAKYTGSPEPTIRWYRNNEPIKKSKFFRVEQSNGVASLDIAECYQEDVAEYKLEAINPAGKATTVANLVLQPKGSKIAGVKVTQGRTVEVKETVKAPHFVSKLSDVVVRPGQTVKFMADIGGDPQPTVAWQFKGRPLQPGRDIKIELKDKTAVLELLRVAPSSEGEYTLSLRSASGAAQCSAQLKLETPPPCSLPLAALSARDSLRASDIGGGEVADGMPANVVLLDPAS